MSRSVAGQCLETDSAPLIYQFLHPIIDYAKALDKPAAQLQQCGAGCGFAMFDDDGSSYPCHVFSSLGFPENRLGEVQDMDLSSMAFQDPRCKGCPYSIACSTCAGCNYLYRGDVALQDETHCRIQQIEAMVCMRYHITRMSRDPSSGSRELVDAIRRLREGVMP